MSSGTPLHCTEVGFHVEVEFYVRLDAWPVHHNDYDEVSNLQGYFSRADSLGVIRHRRVLGGEIGMASTL